MTYGTTEVAPFPSPLESEFFPQSVEVVPFPFPGKGDFFRSPLSRCPIAPFRVG
jgi:hypothetical protein